MSLALSAATLNWMSLAGMLILAYPALSLDRRKRRLDRVERILNEDDAQRRADLMAQLGADVRKRRSSAVAGWRRVDRACLWTGYGLLVLSMALRAVGFGA